MLLAAFALIALQPASAQFANGFITKPAQAPVTAPAFRTPLRVESKGSNSDNCQSTGNPLEGKPLRYLIGGSAGSGSADAITEVSYDTNSPVKNGISIAYCNLFDEKNTKAYGPYLTGSSTAKDYNEGQVDPKGAGWEKNLRAQFDRRKKAGFEYIELDNPDAYRPEDVIGAYNIAAGHPYYFKIIAKNPAISDIKGADNTPVVAHPAVVGIIVEKGAGNPDDMNKLRAKAGKPNIPVWFVGFGRGKGWTDSIAKSAQKHCNMGVTYSDKGEYGNALDVVTPKPVQARGAALIENGTGMR
jgi:hypothetical protein